MVSKTKLLRAFWNCGDNQIIEFAIMRARLNKREKEVLASMLDECRTQEQTAERLELSTRHTQELWRSASDKLLNIPWVKAYSESLL